MAEVELSKEQQAVVDARDCSLLVAAAAGSGKTFVLVKRIMDRILDKIAPLDIDRLLIVTFTNAAAAEMRERIGNAIEKAIEKDPENMQLKKQAALLSSAQISTIDSFCMSVVKENYHALDIDPGFTIEDESVLALLRDDVLTELLDEEYTRATPEFMQLMASYTGHKDDEGVRSMIYKIRHYADSDPRPEDWLDRAEEALDEGFDENGVFDGILTESKALIKSLLSRVEAMRAIALSPLGPAPYDSTCDADRDYFNSLLCADTYEKLGEMLRTTAFSKMATISKKDIESGKILEEKKKAAADVRDEYKKKLGSLKERYYAGTPEQLQGQYDLTKGVTRELLRLTREFMKRCMAAQAERNAYGFSDVEHFAHQILCEKDEEGNIVPTAVAKEMKERFDEIMIDEYQDSSFMQEDILKAVSGEYGGIPNLFMVGDVKQSIYGFRKARPELFNRKYSEFTAEGEHRKIDLFKNFRSRQVVLDSVNVLLSALMKRDTAEIEYDEKAALHFGSAEFTKDEEKHATELMLIDKDLVELQEDSEGAEGANSREEIFDSSKDEKLSSARTTPMEREALAVGLRIKELEKEGFKLSDIAILVRTAKGVTEVFTKVLAKLGIPTCAETGSGFFAAVEIKKVLSYLKIIDNPCQDVAFAAVLYSHFVNMDAEEIAGIVADCGMKNGKRTGLLYDVARLAAAQGNKKLSGFFTVYDELCRASEHLNVHDLLDLLYERTGYKDLVSVMPQGDRRRGNLENLIQLAMTFENSSYAGVHDFLRYIERLEDSEKDFGEAPAESGEGQVRIMTIHKSKGLEFPVVFLSCMGRQFNDTDARDNLLCDQKLGVGIKCINLKKRTKDDGLKLRFLKKKKLMESRAEDVRTLYVALTRAKEKLIMTGTVDKMQQKIRTWAQRPLDDGALSYLDMSSAKNYVDFVAPKIFSGMEEDEISELFEAGTRTRRISGMCGTEEYSSGFVISCLWFAEEAAQKSLEGNGDDIHGSAGSEEDKETSLLQGFMDEIEARRSFVYPFKGKADAPVKVSVSELKLIAIHDTEEEKAVMLETPTAAVDDEPESNEEAKPAPAKERKGARGAERGTLYHEVLEKLQYMGDYSNAAACIESLDAEISRLMEEGFLEKDILDTVSVKRLVKFCMSSVGQRMIAAFKNGKLYREQQFVYGLTNEEYRRFSHSDADTDMVMLQGVIDAFFEENDGLVLVDYKTDKVVSDAAKELTERYSVQLELYAKALSALRKKPVKEKVIYSVSKDLVIAVE
jgi:ATP-dependent helicase/nuclease subunit A